MNNLDFCKFSFGEKTNKVIWEITNQCNYSCEYCIFSSTGKKPRGELPYHKVLDTLQQLKDSGFNYIKFTGGEPFIRDDFIQILIEAKKIGFNFDISTNASFITEDISKQLSLLNMNFIHVSLDGYDIKSHEFVRGKKTFNKTISGLTNLLKYNKNIRIGSVIHSGNDSDLDKIVNLANELRVKEVIFSLMSPIGRMDKNSISLSKKTPNELIEIISKIKSENTKVNHNLKSDLKPISFKINNNACPGGERFLFIDSIGIVSPCTWISEYFPEFHLLSLHHNSLKEILNSPLFQNFKKEKELLTGKCFAFAYENKNKFNKIYSFATENISYIDKLPMRNLSSALVITGSGDQAIFLTEKGVRNITCLDINYLANYYAQLKISAIKSLSYDEFILFFGNYNKEQTFNYHVYKKLTHNLSYEAEKFWNQQYLNNKYSGYSIRNSDLFNLKHDQWEQKILNVPYLASKELYDKIQKSIKLTTFKFITKDFIQIPQEKYDIILLSNIADYSHKMFSGDYLEEFKNKYVEKGLNFLNLGGVMMFSYIYDFENIGNSHLRNKINLPEIRKQYFGEFNYEEIVIKSAISYLKNDVACILKKGSKNEVL